MRIIALILIIIPTVLSAQGQDTIVVYEGFGAFNDRIVDLSNKNLSRFPALSPEVEVLILDNNNISYLPNSIIYLTKLRSLSIRNNKLQNADILGYCESLEELYLSGNPYLSQLPNLIRCNKLKIVDVTSTAINDIPGWIRAMDSLAYFKYSIRK
jgi:Leucine-rich repeat (LRR) protein